MKLLQNIFQVWEENPESSVGEIDKTLKELNLKQGDIPVFVKEGEGPNGEVTYYSIGKTKDSGEKRQGLIYLTISDEIMSFAAPKSCLSYNEIERATNKSDTFAGRFGGHAFINLRETLKDWEKVLISQGKLERDHYHLHPEKNLLKDNPGFLIKWREPEAWDNYDQRVRHQWLVSQVGFFGNPRSYKEAMCGPDDFPEAQSDVPILHAGVKTLDFYYKNMPRLGIETSEKQDMFLEKVVDAVYQLPVFKQHLRQFLESCAA